MQTKAQFKFRGFVIFLLAVFLVVPMLSVSAQDDDDYDDDYYDDEYYDDDYYDDDYYDDDEYYDDVNGDQEEEVLASYEISGIELLGDPTDDHLELWDAFVLVIPEVYLDRFTFFQVLDDEETSGYVYIDEDDDERFVLALNLIELDEPDELRHTIVHEFAHTVTINAAQIDVRLERGGTCPTFELEEGCSESDSYIFAFYELFYADGESTNMDDFVTEYASENIAEDMAESFTFFILEDEERDGDSIADDKVNFFYNFSELVELRDEIREMIGAD